jgi:hypothetical protein
MSRTPQAAATGTAVAVTAGGTADFTLTPVLAKNLKFANTPDVGNVTVTATLIETATGGSPGSNRPTTVELRTGAGVSLATSGTVNVTGGTATNYTYTLTVTKDTVVAAGGTLVLRLRNNSGSRSISLSQNVTGLTSSRIAFNTPTVINVDSVTVYNAVYPAATQNTVYSPGSQVFICAVVSDPFGSADVGSANITLVDANGVTQVSGAAMTNKGATNCTGTASTSVEALEYAFTLPAAGTAATGNWTATVTGNEGTEGTVTQSSNGSFEVNVPALTIMKTVLVSTDPIEGATRAKAIPGATAQYTITVLNSGRGSVDAGTMVISDPVPANTVLSLPAKPPFTFTDGATSSGLSVGANDTSITYTDHSNVAYTPTCTRPCTDANIGGFTITLNGTMNGKTGASAPSFTISFQVVIQ